MDYLFIFSFFIANVFLAYLISSDELIKMITEGPSNNLSTLIFIDFTGVFYFVFAWFREQVYYCLSLWKNARCFIR